MLVTEKNSSETKKYKEGGFKWGLIDYTRTTFDQEYDLFYEIISSERLPSFEDAKTKYPRIEENVSIMVKMNFYSFAESLFPGSRSFNKEEQIIFKKIKNKIFKDIWLNMSEEFINLFKELFPSISTGTKEQLQVFIKQHQENPKLYYSLKSKNEIYQGDIISKIPFLYIKENGEIKQGILDGMIISHSCDIERKETILIAPVYNMELFIQEYKNNLHNINALKKNMIYDKFYLPQYSSGYGDFITDLSCITTFEREYIYKGIKNDKIEILASLSQTGYYYFICKLTVHLLRMEAQEISREIL